jgi:hypothetical protein|tara:strand:+ start:166 stop:528 length:363 start_codon:yes stop_codon:yes gene_type:complete
MKNIFYTLLITIITITTYSQDLNYPKAFKKSIKKIDIFLLENGFEKTESNFLKEKSTVSNLYYNDTLKVILVKVKNYGIEAMSAATRSLGYQGVIQCSKRYSSVLWNADRPTKVYIIKHV